MLPERSHRKRNAAGREEDVPWLDVAVDEALRVHPLEPAQHVAPEACEQPDGQRLAEQSSP